MPEAAPASALRSRVGLASGGVSLPGTGGYIPEELYQPKEGEKPEEAEQKSIAGQQGGQGGKGGGIGGKVGGIAGSFLGPIGGMVGSGLGSMLGGMFREGGRVGLAAGGDPAAHSVSAVEPER